MWQKRPRKSFLKGREVEMFEDQNNMPYKMDCKYDFNFKGDEPIPD